MCGLVAVIRPAGIDPRRLAAMRDALAHRGPDAAEQWIEGPVGLAHRRLSIIDTSDASAQPMHSADGRFVLVFNGEIYNYVELRETLVQAGRRFRTTGDTEVLLQAFEHWGEDALPRLNGMFAFALWDRRQRRLLIVRDRFGEKPLFVAEGPHGLAVASEIKGLLRDPDIDDSVDEAVLAAYGASAYFEEASPTFFRAVRRLPAAHAAWFDADGRRVRTWRYWAPDYDRVDHMITPGEAVERFRELLTRSVRMRLRSDVPVGSSLSGGLDSSIVVGLLAQECGFGARSFRQDTFSARFPDDPTLDEGSFIDAVVDATGAAPHAVIPTPEALMRECGRLHLAQEEPFLSASIYLQFCVARLASENGVVVQLDGQGADELLGGYQYYFRQHQLDLAELGEWDALATTTEAFNTRLQTAAASYTDSGRRFNAATAYSLEEANAMRGRNEPLPTYGGGPWTEGMPSAGPGGRMRRIMAEAMQCNSLPQLLRYADRNAMAFSRESRMPYLDHDLVDFCIGLPDTMFFRDGWQKWVLREAAVGVIPEPVRLRADKVGYAAPLDVWMRGPMKRWCEERLFEGPATQAPGHDEAALRAAWAQHQAGANSSWTLWRWISLNEWMTLGRSGAWRGTDSPQAAIAAEPRPSLLRRAFGRFLPN